MNTIRYVFEAKQPELNGLVVKYGLSPATSKHDLWVKTNFLVKKFKEDFMKDIADIHPDKDLLAWSFSLDKQKVDANNFEPKPTTSELQNILNNVSVIPQKSSNACGCSGADGEKTSGCNGCESMKSNITGTEIKEKIQNNLPLVIVGSLAIVVGLIALSNRRLV